MMSKMGNDISNKYCLLSVEVTNIFNNLREIANTFILFLDCFYILKYFLCICLDLHFLSLNGLLVVCI